MASGGRLKITTDQSILRTKSATWQINVNTKPNTRHDNQFSAELRSSDNSCLLSLFTMRSSPLTAQRMHPISKMKPRGGAELCPVRHRHITSSGIRHLGELVHDTALRSSQFRRDTPYRVHPRHRIHPIQPSKVAVLFKADLTSQQSCARSSYGRVPEQFPTRLAFSILVNAVISSTWSVGTIAAAVHPGPVTIHAPCTWWHQPIHD